MHVLPLPFESPSGFEQDCLCCIQSFSSCSGVLSSLPHLAMCSC